MKAASKILLVLLSLVTTGAAHVGSPDVYYEDHAGPYPLSVVVRMPLVVPGVAVIEVRSLSDNLKSIQVVPTRIQGEGSKFAPVPDVAERASDDPKLFRAHLWIMMRGAWKVQITADGEKGKGELSVPLAAAPGNSLALQGPLKWLLTGLMAVLVIGLVGIAGAAVREGMSDPATAPVPSSKRRSARRVMICTALLVIAVLAAGKFWWNWEAASTAQAAYTVPRVVTSLSASNTLLLRLQRTDSGRWAERIQLDDLIPDHGHLMHLFLIRFPDMDRMYHLHPHQDSAGQFSQNMPALEPGRYKVFADVVHATGFPETQTAEITLPETHEGTLQGDDSFATGISLLSKIQNTNVTYLEDGGRIIWLDSNVFVPPREPVKLHFRVEDASGKPATDLEPYMGMAGHLILISSDGTVFAHLHPNGSPPMAAVQLANGTGMADHAGHNIPSEISFPYGFPKAGLYRIFVQFKRAGRIETGVFNVSIVQAIDN